MSYQELPPREESRFKLESAYSERLHSLLGTCFAHEAFPNPVTETAHLASQTLTTPNSYLRLRRYVPALNAQELVLDPDEQWFFEHKTLTGLKARVGQSLGTILLGTSYPELDAFISTFPNVNKVIQEFGQPLMPVIATQSVRTHYGAPGSRVTVDEQLSYFGFTWGSLHAPRLGISPAIKVELKVEQPELGSNAVEEFNNICGLLQGAPFEDGEVARDMSTMYQQFLLAQ